MTDLFAALNAELARQFGQAIRNVPLPQFPAPTVIQAQEAPQGFTVGVSSHDDHAEQIPS